MARKAIVLVHGLGAKANGEGIENFTQAIKTHHQHAKVSIKDSPPVRGQVGHQLVVEPLKEGEPVTHDVYEMFWGDQKVGISDVNRVLKPFKALGLVFYWLGTKGILRWNDAGKRWTLLLSMLTLVLWYLSLLALMALAVVKVPGDEDAPKKEKVGELFIDQQTAYGGFSLQDSESPELSAVAAADTTVSIDSVASSATKKKKKDSLRNRYDRTKKRIFDYIRDSYWIAILALLGTSFFSHAKVKTAIDGIYFFREYLKQKDIRNRIRTRLKIITFELLESGEYDEILIVGNSFGSVISVEFFSTFDLDIKGTSIKLVTMGSALSFLQKREAWLGEMMQKVYDNDKLHAWHDYYSKYDWLSSQTRVEEQNHSRATDFFSTEVPMRKNIFQRWENHNRYLHDQMVIDRILAIEKKPQPQKSEEEL